MLFQSVPINLKGRDIAVGDIHGHFTRLQVALDDIGFDPTVDRLFSVGDLVDRGPESEECTEWLNKPWFFAVQGNHEDLAVRHVRTGQVDEDNYTRNGGGWFLRLPPRSQAYVATALAELPIAMEIETDAGFIGITHADCPAGTWDDLRDTLRNSKSSRELKAAQKVCQWSRERILTGDTTWVLGIRAVIVGHTPLPLMTQLGNVYHIDTGGWRHDGRGHFTLLDLVTLEPIR